MGRPDPSLLNDPDGWRGREMTQVDTITPRLHAEFRATFAPHLADVAEGDVPLGLHWCLSPAIEPMAGLGADGHPMKGGFLPPVPLPRRMWAGGEIETIDALREGDLVTRRSRIGDIARKSGRSGALCFVAVHHEYATDRGLGIRERHDIVYREAGSAASGSTATLAATHAADIEWRVEMNSVLLFRYSAMTFNGHRIHYDGSYAANDEGYDGLVVHGPIQATLLFNLAATLLGRAPRHFSYRASSPMIAGGEMIASGTFTGNREVTCRAASADGRTCMSAVASDAAK